MHFILYSEIILHIYITYTLHNNKHEISKQLLSKVHTDE